MKHKTQSLQESFKSQEELLSCSDKKHILLMSNRISCGMMLMKKESKRWEMLCSNICMVTTQNWFWAVLSLCACVASEQFWASVLALRVKSLSICVSAHGGCAWRASKKVCSSPDALCTDMSCCMTLACEIEYMKFVFTYIYTVYIIYDT